MKQSFGKTLLSFFLAVTLMASVVAGAISVSVLHAKASVPAAGYFDDLVSEALDYVPLDKTRDFANHINDIKAKLNDTYAAVFVICNTDHTQFFFGSFNVSSGTDMNQFYWYSDGSNLRFRRNNNQISYAFFLVSAVCVFGANYQSFNYSGSSLANATFNNYTFGTVTNNLYYPSPSYCSSVDLECYTTVNIRDSNGVYVTPNLYSGSSPVPQVIDFNLVKFNLGERTYLTTQDQNIIFNTQPLDDDYLWWYIGFMQEDGSDSLDLILEYRDLILIPGASAWLNVGLTNIHEQGVLAYDITDMLFWHDIWSSEFVWVSEDPGSQDPSQWTAYAEAVNVPFLLGEDPNGQPDSYTQAWDQFNTYVSNYNTTHVIPEQLSDWIFDTDGAKLFPVTVQVPHAIWMDLYHSSDAPNNHVWRWGGLLAEEQGFQYSLFDTVIIGASNSGYTIRYFYSDTLDPMYQPIEFMALENVLDSFDVVIIVPDSDGYLNSVAQAYGFTGETGVVYVPDSAELVGNNWTGFAIVTEKAIAKQQLWNFNEGISKLYQLEVDYIDSEDKWKDSFLLWSASIFDMLNSIGGQLTQIINIISGWDFNNYVERITDRLDELINNTGELEWDFWYMSLFSWINQFRPSNSDFASGLEQFDNNWEDFPELPAPSTVPLLPTIGG